MAERAENRRALALLAALDRDLLRESECFLGGGTAVSLVCGEARVSRDVDLLCASQDGYRRLRGVIFQAGARGLATREIELLREVRADQYGIRTAVRVEGEPVKLEIIREARIPLEGASDPRLPLVRLCDVDLVAEKLLANADRYTDDAVLGRDAIDLVVLEATLGALPEAAWEKARAAYGVSVDAAWERALDALARRPDFLARALDGLAVTKEGRDLVRARLARR